MKVEAQDLRVHCSTSREVVSCVALGTTLTVPASRLIIHFMTLLHAFSSTNFEMMLFEGTKMIFRGTAGSVVASVPGRECKL